jgi:hypothetical protein
VVDGRRSRQTGGEKGRSRTFFFSFFPGQLNARGTSQASLSGGFPLVCVRREGKEKEAPFVRREYLTQPGRVPFPSLPDFLLSFVSLFAKRSGSPEGRFSCLFLPYFHVVVFDGLLLPFRR